jgi:fructokinase
LESQTRPIVALGEVLWDILPGRPRAGGAPFNFAFHCQQLGHPAILVSRVGDDQLGHDLRAEVRRLGMSDEFIQTDREHPTGTVRVEVSASGEPTYTIAENVAWDFLEWEPRLDELAKCARAICFGTLAQRSRATQSVIYAFISSSAEDTLTVCDLNLRPPFDSTEVIEDWLFGFFSG